METVFIDPSQRARVPIRFKINRAARLIFNLMENGVNVTSTTGWTWQLVLKKNPGDRLSIWSLTLGSGLRYEVYTEYQLIADLTPDQNNIEEGEYFLELIRTDLARSWVEFDALYNFSAPNV